MAPIVAVPALVTAFVAHRHGFRKALVFALLPFLLLLPNYYTWKLPGIPILTFHDYAVLAVGVALFCSRDRQLYRFDRLDLLVFFHVLWMAASEYHLKGFQDGRNLLFLRGVAILIPYLVGRVVARHDGLLIGVLTMMTLLGALIGLVAPYEWRMGSDPFDFWRRWWPDAPWSGALYRLGGRRVAGPFAHSICQGFFFSMLLPLTWWLFDQKLLRWPARHRRWMRPAVVVGVSLGLLAPMARGPLIGAVLALGITRFGWLKQRGPALILAGFAALAFVLLFLDDLVAYVSVSRGEARDEAQENAAYRNEMLEHYRAIVDAEPVWGYGKDQFPVVRGMVSIDNQYLFLSLSHGYPASWSFLLSMLVPALCLLQRLLRCRHDLPLARLGWAFVGLLVGALLTQTTVFAGTQTVEVLFLLIGIAVTLRRRLDPTLRDDR